MHKKLPPEKYLFKFYIQNTCKLSNNKAFNKIKNNHGFEKHFCDRI